MAKNKAEKVNHCVVIVSYTDFPSMFYYMYKIKNYEFENDLSKEKVFAPVHFYDEINKKLLDSHFEVMFKNEDREWQNQCKKNLEQMIADAAKTVWHGFSYKKTNEWLRDSAAAVKLKTELNSKFKKIDTLQKFADFTDEYNTGVLTVFKKVEFMVGD